MQMNSKFLYCLIRSSYTTNYNGQPLDDLSEDLFLWQNLPNMISLSDLKNETVTARAHSFNYPTSALLNASNYPWRRLHNAPAGMLLTIRRHSLPSHHSDGSDPKRVDKHRMCPLTDSN